VRPGTRRQSLTLWCAEKLPESSRVEGANRERSAHIEQIAIARHEDVSVASHGGGDNPLIGSIANDVGRWLIRFRNRWKRREHRVDGVHAIGRHLQLAPQHAMELREDDIANHEIMFGKHRTKDIGAQAPRGKGGHQNVRVEANSHDTARNTSSSVR